MQARSAFYSIGGMIPPMLAAASGVRAPLIACTVLCMSTAFGGSFDAAVSYLWSRDNSMDAGNPSVVAVPSAESTPLVQSEARSRARRRTRSDSYSGDGLTAPKGSMSSARNASEAPLESEELTVLGLIIDSHQLGSDKSGECTSVVENLVTTVLDATPYCNITDAERNDPAFEPNINKTLSFASSKIVHTITRTDAIGMSPAQVSFVDDLKDSVVLVPRKARLLLALMALLFYSCMTSFVGWLPSYFKLKVFPDHNDWTMMGSQMVSTFFFFMTIGCLASIPCSVYVSITKMIRFHLALVSSGGILLQLAVVVRPVPVTSLLLIGAGFMGYGISAIFPLVVTVSNDYGFTM